MSLVYICEGPFSTGGVVKLRLECAEEKEEKHGCRNVGLKISLRPLARLPTVQKNVFNKGISTQNLAFRSL
jgi:hypothetical protein